MFLRRENLDFVFGFRVRNSEEAEPILELGLLEGAPCSSREFGLCTFPRTTVKGAKMVDEVDVQSICLVLLGPYSPFGGEP